jgi:hypothetical protein
MLDRLDHLLPVYLGWPEPAPGFSGSLSALVGLRLFIAAILNQISTGVQNGLITVLAIASVRMVVQRILTGPKIKRVSADTVTIALAVILIALITLDSSRSNFGHVWVPMITSQLGLMLMLFVVLRVGVLGAVFAFSTNFLMTRLPMTLDGSRFYAGQGWVVVLGILALAVVGFRWARAGESTFGEGTSA